MKEITDKHECLQILKQICKAMDGDINASFCEEVQIHIKKCHLCKSYVESMKDTITFCKKLINEDIPPAMEERLWEILKLTKPDTLTSK